MSRSTSLVAALGAAVLLLAGCNFNVTPCATNADCPSGATCEQNFCVRAEDGGKDSGVDAGTDAGTSCLGGCSAWQTCNPTVVGGRCEDVRVRIVTPATDGLEFGGGTSMTLGATVTQWDGGPYSVAQLPVVVPAGATGPGMLQETTVGSGTYQGNYALANATGTLSFEVGWAGARDTRSIRVSACTVTCADWEACVPNADGGTCQSLNLSLTWLQPMQGATFGASGPVALALQVGGGSFTKPIPFSVAGGGVASGTLMSSGVGNVWNGTATLGSTNGQRTLIAGWDGGPTSPALVVNVDALPPQLGLVVPGDGGAFQRDDVVYAVVTASEALSDAGVTLGGVDMARVANGQCATFGMTPDAAACFELDFSRPPFLSFDGGMGLTVSGVDLYANGASTGAGQRDVTRLRWARQLAAGQVVQALAVGSDGVVYAGTSAGAASNLMRVLPDGTVDGGAVFDVQALAVDSRANVDTLYVAYNAGNRGNLMALEAQTLQAAFSAACQGAAGSRTYSGLALYRPASETLAVGSINSVAAVNGTGCLYRPTSGLAVGFGTNDDLDAPVVPTAVSTAANVTIAGSMAAFLKHTGSGAFFVPVTLNGTSTPVVGTAGLLNAVNPSVGQARVPATADAGTLISTRAGAMSQLFLRGTAVPGEGTLGTPNDKGVAAIVDATEAYAGMGSTLVRFSPQSLSSSTEVATVTGDFVRTSPVLGAARDGGSGGEGYAVSNLGTVIAFAQGSGTALWRSPGGVVTAGEHVNTHPTFDCNRARPASRTGVLYFGTDTGFLFAVVVDSPKLLDTPAAWPKYQRTQGNAGNTDSATFPINWPACP
jgi:hypothetical protein